MFSHLRKKMAVKVPIKVTALTISSYLSHKLGGMEQRGAIQCKINQTCELVKKCVAYLSRGN